MYSHTGGAVRPDHLAKGICISFRMLLATHATDLPAPLAKYCDISYADRPA